MTSPTGSGVYHSAARYSVSIREGKYAKKKEKEQKAFRDGIFKLLRSPRIDSQESILAAYVCLLGGPLRQPCFY
jgi:hypothetical protein